jgi:hypothetical protein
LLSDFESCSQSVDVLGDLKMARETAYAGNKDEERKQIGGEVRDSLVKPILIQAQGTCSVESRQPSMHLICG